MFLLSSVLFFITGTVLASFTNAAAYRSARGETVLKGRSHCTHCGRSLAPIDLIPVLSFLFFGGRCRTCKAKLSPRYLLIELLGGLCCLILFWKIGVSIKLITAIPTVFVLLYAALCDLETMEIPDVAHALLLAVTVVHMLLFRKDIYSLALGMFAVSLPLAVLYTFNDNLFGAGDIKLFFAVGGILGGWGSLFALLFALILGGLYGFILMLTKHYRRGDHMPFGNFIAIGCFLALLFTPDILNFYSGLIHL